MKFKMWFESEDSLAWVLDSGQTSYKGVGEEKLVGEPVRHGINLYRDQYGSYRFVMHHDGVPVAGMQVVNQGGKKGQAVVSNIYTHPDYRRSGFATALFQHAKQMFPNLVVSDHRSDAGQAWASSL